AIQLWKFIYYRAEQLNTSSEARCYPSRGNPRSAAPTRQRTRLPERSAYPAADRRAWLVVWRCRLFQGLLERTSHDGRGARHETNAQTEEAGRAASCHLQQRRKDQNVRARRSHRGCHRGFGGAADAKDHLAEGHQQTEICQGWRATHVSAAGC